MFPWLVLFLIGQSVAGPFHRAYIQEYLLPPQWNLDEKEADVEFINANGFQRNAVENPVVTENTLDDDTITHAEYGSERFPLRDAVEALPANQMNLQAASLLLQDSKEPSGRVPLRDAVEHREAPFFSNVDHESIWIEPLAPPTLTRTHQIVDPKMVCHLDSGAVHRVEPFSLFPQSIPDHKCSHLVYAAATLDPEELVIVSKDPEYDEIKGGYKAVTGHRSRNPALQVLVSIATSNRGKLFSEVTKNHCTLHCERLAKSILTFLRANDFDGVEIDWENSAEHSNDLRLLLKTIKKSFDVQGEYTLAVAQRPEDPVDQEITSIADLVLLRAWRESPGFRREKLALHPAPLRYVVRATNRWIESVPREHRSKIILGIPVFGQGYTLKFGNFTDAGAPIIGPGIGGVYNKRQNGRMAYYEICEKLEDGLWISGRDEEGPYIKRGDQWVGYEDPLSVKIKVAYVRSTGLGGVSLWSVDLDDFQGICGNPWPMLNAAIESIGFYDEKRVKNCTTEGLFTDPDNCSGFYSCYNGVQYQGQCGQGNFFNSANGRCVKANTELCKPRQVDRIQDGGSSTEIREVEEAQNLEITPEKGPRVACYVTSWSLYRKGDGMFAPERLDTRLCTDVIYAFAGLNPDTLLIQPFDPWADIENNLYERVTMLKGSRVLLAIGGWTDSTGDKYSRLISNGASRRKFVASTINFLKKHNFDGLSFEWNYPRCWQSDCRKGPDTDKPNLTKLIRELKKEFDQQEPRLTLAVALSGYKEIIDRGYEVYEISKIVDFMSVMTYDYHGAWESRTGHLSPLFGSAADPNPYYNVNSTVEYLVSLGADKSKLLIGVPLYGQAYRLSSEDLNDIGDPATGPGTAGEFTRQPGMLAYYEICDRIKNKGWKNGLGPNAYHRDQWVGYDDRESVFAKGRYILQNGFGGASLWTVDLDDFLNRCCSESFPLLKSINRALGRLKSKASEGCQRPPEPVTPQPPTLTPHSDAVDGTPRPTTPIPQSTTWPTWTEKPSTSTQKTTRTTWPTWTWSQKPSSGPDTTSKRPQSTTLSMSTTFSWTEPTSSSVSSIWTSTKEPPVESTEESSDPDSLKPGTPCYIGEYVPDPGSCSSYFRCVLGELQREQCAPGLHWDARRGICDWPTAAKCDTKTSSTTRRPTWTTPKSTTFSVWSTSKATTQRPRPSTQRPGITERPVQKPGKSCEHGQYYAYPNSCTSFLVCVNGNLVSQQCGPGLNWNNEKNMCDWAFKAPCDKPMKSASLIAANSKSSPCIPGSYSGVPGDCQSYQACLWGRHEVFKCAPGLHFNQQTRICDWPSRANCQEKNPTSTEDREPITSTTSRPTNRPTEEHWEPSTTQPTSTTSSTLIDPDKVSPLSGYYKVVCYFTNWAWYRRGVGRYLPENIDHTLCTHIVYGFAVLDYSELTIKAHDSWADYDNRFYERVVAYKKRGLKVSLALGGWNDSAGDKYSRLVNSPTARRKFVSHVVQFLEKYDFDGLDLDWEYPVCWQVDCKKGPASDKQGFADLLKELSSEMKPKGLLLSSAVSPSKQVVDKGYDVPALAKYLDWIAVMTYDFHGQWDKKTGHVAPLYYHPDDDYYYFNANYSINYWISNGAPRRNIVMGMPLYGQSFTINDPSAGAGLNVPASAGQAGEFTRAAGFLAYYEICDRIRNRGWNVVQDPEHRMGPYAFKGNQWVSFDDVESIRRKAQYVKDMGLGGGMVWALDLDDFRGRCGEGQHPLMRTIQGVLSDTPSKVDEPCRPPIEQSDLDQAAVTPAPTVAAAPVTTAIPSSTSKDHLQSDSGFKMICYFTNWAWYRQEGGKFLPEDIDTDLCTHVLYGFAVLDGSQLTIKSHDPWADIDNKFYERVAALKSKGIKVLMAIGGWNDSAGDKYSRLVNSPSARRRFIENVIQFIEKYEFQGLDLDWEYPVCWQVDCNRGLTSDKEAFASFVKELSEEFQPRGLLLSAAVSPSKRVIDAGYDVPTLAKYFDWISVMTYDYHGQWDKKTGHVAPLYRMPNDWEPTFNANFSIHYWIEMGAPPNKLVMGVPMYGQSFSLAERSQRGLNAPTYGGGEAGEATRARGFLSYYEICERTLKNGWTVVEDKQRRIGPYAYKGDQWVSFDDAKQVKIKAELIKDLGLAGGMVWALDLDDFKNRCGCEPSPLLRTMNRVLRGYPKGPLCPVTSEFTTIDDDELSTSTTTREPSWELTTSQRPTYLPPTSSPEDSSSDIDDTIEIDVESPWVIASPEDCEGRLFIPHKKDCSKYFLCNFGKLTEHSCPRGLYWNEDRCDWPENTRCRDTQRQSNELLPLTAAKENQKKVICYLMEWARKRPGAGKFLPEDIEPDLCTHVVYGLATLDIEQLIIQNPLDSRQKKFLNRITSMRSRTGLKILLGLGGWEESKDSKYSKLAHNSLERQRFARYAAQYIENHGFDGLDLIWEYPVCWQVNCNRGPASDREAFADLLKDLSATFKPKGLLLSTAVSSSKNVIDVAYSVPALVQYLDWIGVMSYDYHGYWDSKTGHAAPIYQALNKPTDHLNVNFSMSYWIEQGVPSNKLVMGVPTYGQSFTLSREPLTTETPALDVEVSGPGYPGEFTKSAGILAYYEICNNVRYRGWSAVKDPQSLVGPYATKGDQWVSYEDVSTVTKKADIIRELNLGGAMIWSLDLDDFKNQCSCGRYPLITALSQEIKGERDHRMDCT